MENHVSIIKKNLNILYSLANNNIKDRIPYQNILNDLEKFISKPTIDNNPIVQNLNIQMEILKTRISEVNEDPISKINFWISYMYWAVWCTFRNSGIGHLYDFSIEHSTIKCSVNIDMYIHKDFFEGKDEYEKRAEEYLKYLDSKGIERIRDNGGHYYLEDNKKNKKFLKEFIEQFCKPIKTELTIRNNFIKSITFYITKDGEFSFYKNSYDNNKKIKGEFLSDYDIETIINDTKEWYQAISLLEEVISTDSSKIDKINKTVNNLSLTIYNQLCDICEVSNEITKQYKEIITPNKESNFKARQDEEAIGSTYNVEILIDTLKDFKNNLEEYMQKKYCLYLESFKINETKIITFKWNSYNWHLMANYPEDAIDETNDYYVDIENVRNYLDLIEDFATEESFIGMTDKNMSFFENILSNELYSEVKDITISYYKGKKYISSVTYMVNDFKSLIEKYKE